MRTIEEVIAELRNDIHSDVYLGKKTINTYLDEVLEIHKVERPHGEWIIDGHHYKCSRCGKTLAIMFSETDDDDLIGCPFCLADMRGGTQ